MGRSKKEATPSFVLPVIQGDKMQQLQQLYGGVPNVVNGWYGCTRCGLSEQRRGSDIVFGDGNPEARVMIIGEAPGEEEEYGSVPFVGSAGRLLNQILAQTSGDPKILELSRWFRGASRTNDNVRYFHESVIAWRRQEFFITNIVGCRPTFQNGNRVENRPPTSTEVEACWERVHQMIYIVDPWLIIASGKSPLEGLVKKKTGIEKVRGQIFDMTLQGRLGPVTYPVMATLHPSYLLRRADWDNPRGDFAKTVQDFDSARRILDFMREHNGMMPPNRGM